MLPGNRRMSAQRIAWLGLALCFFCVPTLVFGQASPLLTGAESVQANVIAWLTPLAIIFVMVLGVLAMANQISWGWCIGALIGIGIAFGAPQIVAWVRTMFAV